jgi:hypothetical protein
MWRRGCLKGHGRVLWIYLNGQTNSLVGEVGRKRLRFAHHWSALTNHFAIGDTDGAPMSAWHGVGV